MKSSAGRSRAGSGGPAAAKRPGSAAPPRSRSSPARRGALDLLDAAARREFPSTLYLEGPSEPLKAAILAELKHHWAAATPDSPPPQVFRAAESTVEAVLSAFQGTSLFSPRDLFIVLDVESLSRSEKKIRALADGLMAPAGESCLVLVESAADTPRKSLDPLRAASRVRVECFPPIRSELLRWGARRPARERVTASAGAVEAVVDACEGDSLAFFSELEKLCTWAGEGGTIGREDVAALLRPVVGADLPEYLSAVALGDPGLASQRLGRLLAEGASEGTVLFALSNLVAGSLGGWARHRELSEALRRRVSPRALARSLDAVYRAEAAWKTGRADVVALLEQATREVASAA
jgi:DNA polymerase III delta subunit